jgi:hypothetical protein
MDGWCNVSTNQENHGAVICNKVVKTYLLEILTTTTTTTTTSTTTTTFNISTISTTFTNYYCYNNYFYH